MCYHVMNRGNARTEVFHKDYDYHRFTEMLDEALNRRPMRLLSWCLMPNHFHLVLWPYGDGDLGTWMQWLMTTHVRRYHRHYETSGHIWQGRFKAFPIQDDSHYLTVLRYVESNPLRANLVQRAEQWKWSSLHSLEHPGQPPSLAAGPLCRPANWLPLVNEYQTQEGIEQIQISIKRQRPFGDPKWTQKTATNLALQYTLRPPGRPKAKL